MKALYNEYLTGAEREAEIIITESNAQLAKLNVLFEAVHASLEANLLAAEAKVFAESGTYDDLTMLYTEAENDANEKEGGILKSIFNAIKKFFEKIKNFFVGKKDDDIPESMEIDKETAEHVGIIEKAKSNIQSGINKFRSGDYLGAMADFGKVVLVPVAGAAVTGVVIWKREVISEKLKSCGGIRGLIENGITAAEGKIDESKLSDEIKNALKSGLNKLKEFADKIFKVESKIWGKIEEWKNKRKANSNNDDDASAEEPKNNEDDSNKGDEATPTEEPKNNEDDSNKGDEATPTEEPKNNEDDATTDAQAKIAVQRKVDAATESDRKALAKERPIPNDIRTKITDHAKRYFNNKKSKKKYGDWHKRLDSIEDKIKYALNTEPDYDKALKKANQLANEFMQYFEYASLHDIDIDDDLSNIFIESELVEEEYNELVEAFAEL